MLEQIDISIFRYINSELTNSFFDSFFPIYTDLHRQGNWSVALLLFLIGLWIYKKHRAAAPQLVALIISIFISEAVCHRLLKPTFERKRPEFSVSDVTLKTHSHSGLSFPSTHASNAFTAARIAAYAFPGGQIAFYSLAGLVAFSRVYVGVHFPSDVLAGSLIGLLIGTLAVLCLRKYISHRALKVS